MWSKPSSRCPSFCRRPCLGFYVLVAIGPLSPLGRWYHSLTGGSLAFTFRGLVLGSVLYSLPFAVQPIAAGVRVGGSQAARRVGHAGRFALAHVLERSYCRSGFPGVLTGLVLSFAHTLGEFGVVLMIGGNIPGATQTVSILIYDQVQSLNYAVANRTALLLLLLCFVLLTILYGLRRTGKWVLWGWQ